MKKRLNSNVLPGLVEMSGKRIADIGCGDGTIARLMARHGARVFGVECNKELLEKARDAKPAGGEVYIDGVAENLPFENASIDVVVFFNSLHHIQIDNMQTALCEAARILKPQGIIFIGEPVAQGAHFELMAPVHDETHVRAAAYDAIQSAEKTAGLSIVREVTYIHPARYADFDAFRARLLAINPDRHEDFDACATELRARFDSLGQRRDDGVEFDQPMRVNLLQKS